MSQFTVESPSTPGIIKFSPNEQSMPKNGTTLDLKRQIFPFPDDKASHSEQQHLSKAASDQGHCSRPRRLVNTSSNKPEIDWEVGTDKQLCSEEKEAKSQAVWPPLYHQADPRRPHSLFVKVGSVSVEQHRAELKFNALNPEGRNLKMGPCLFSARLSLLFLCISVSGWRESVLASKWCHRETYFAETQLFLLDFSISQAYQHNFRVQSTTEQSNLLLSNNRINREQNKNTAEF